MDIVTDKCILDSCIEQFWNTLDEKFISEEELSSKVTRSLKINDGEFYCWNINNTRGSGTNGPLRHHIFITYHNQFNERKDVMEVVVPLEYPIGQLPFGRIGRENGKYHLLRAVNGFNAKSVPPNFTDRVRQHLSADITRIDDREWIIICSISDFNSKSFVRIIKIIAACKYNLDIPDSLRSDHKSDNIINDIDEIRRNESLDDTEKQQLINARVGQGKFRQNVIDYWNGACAVTKCDDVSILIASHIKPWRECNNNERLDLFNGLLLTPNIDKLFDRGLISFADNGSMLISVKQITDNNQKILGIQLNYSIDRRKLDNKHREFLRYHREYFGFED